MFIYLGFILSKGVCYYSVQNLLFSSSLPKI